jgi:6-phosphogluconolactonase (cycloisomerase 2 family)
MNLGRRNGGGIILTAVALAVGMFSQTSTGSARLVSIEEWPDVGEVCQWEPASADSSVASGLGTNNLFAALQAGSANAASQRGEGTTDLTRPPVRQLWDTDPAYTAIAVDTRSDEVVLQDGNTWSIKIFDRSENTPPTAARSEPKRMIVGGKSEIQFNSGVYVDPANGDIYSVENDTGDAIVVFSHDARGDTEPKRELHVIHRAFAIDVDEVKQEMYVTVNHPPQVAVYRKMASGDEKPLRVLRGDRTRLSDVHGVAVDIKNQLLFVNSWGNITTEANVSGGRNELPSIAVYPLNAGGDVAPLRVIEGPRTQMNWPGTMTVDPESGDLYVANDLGHSVLVFHGRTDQGDVAPARVIKGSRTGLRYPSGVAIDRKNRELWVSNFGNASATVYPLMASGDVAPLRTIRSAPQGKKSLNFGKTASVAYDTKREEILVPN